MKRISWGSAILLAGAISCPGQTAGMAASGQYAVTERGPHHRVWERIEYEQTRSGPMPKKHRFVELSTGLNFWDAQTGQWLESKEEIEGFPGGAIARQGQHKVIFANNLATAGAIDMEAPDGKRFRSHVLGLSYFDSASGKSVMIAQVKNCQGKIVGGNQVIYEDAFDADGFGASVRFTYTKAGFEQDIILKDRPPAPDAYGLDPRTTRLQVLTEFLDPPSPAIGIAPPPPTEEGALPDQNLDFGAMRIGTGKAFSCGQQQQDDGSSETPTAKQWLNLEGRTVLLEEVNVTTIQAELQSLPKAEGAALTPPADSPLKVPSNKIQLPKLSGTRTTNTMEFAKTAAARRGFVLDYLTLNGTLTNYLFKGDTTYYISGPVYLYGAPGGAVTIEGCAVLKYTNSASAGITIQDTNFVCATAPFRPAVLTSKDDDTAGEILSGSTGNPTNGPANYLTFNSPCAKLQHLRFTYAQIALVSYGIAPVPVWHCQFVQCGRAIAVRANPDFSKAQELHDVLLARCGFGLGASVRAGNCDVRVAGEHVTADTVGQLFTGSSQCGVYACLTNCILTAVTDVVPPAVGDAYLDHCLVATNGTGIYQTVGGASYYLADNSTNRNAGTTNISSALLSDLRQMTTYPPIVYSNATISVPTTLGPQAQRDTDLPDRGYHYCLIDYAFGGVTADTNLTFAPGTAVGWFRTTSGYYHAGHGLHLSDRQTVTFDGTATAPCYWVRCNMVQEGGNGQWEMRFGPGGITGSAWPDISDSPTLIARFTRFSMQTMDDQHYRDDYGWLIARTTGCEYYGAGVGGYNMQHYHTNCLWVRSGPGFWTDWPDSALVVRNCTMHGGILGFGRFNDGANVPVVLRDNAFDGTSIVETDDDPCANADKQHNAYLTGSDQLACSDNDVTVTSFNWRTGPLGNYYLPTNSALTNAGSITADLIGLYHFTTQTNQVKETNSVVDIGYHYVALNANGNPIDSDGDGTPDYLEDNGNGSVDSGETDWQSASDLGLKVLITRPKTNSSIP